MQSILVAFDGSQQSRAALEYAFQTFPDAEFTVLYALDIDRSKSGLSDVKSVLRWLKSSEERAHELRDSINDTSERYDVTATSEFVVGKMAKKVIQRCGSEEFNQIVVGNYSRSGQRTGLFSNVTERIVRRASLPVTAVQPVDDGSYRTPPERVLVPVDGSDQANRAIDYACEHFPRANITALNVVDPLVAHFDELDTDKWGTSTVEEWETEIESHSSEIESLSQSLRNQSTSVLDRAASRAANHGIELTTASVEGWPVERILAYVEDSSIDHVCIGSHSRSGFERFVLGSTSENVLRRCAVPITTLRIHEKKTVVTD